MERAQSDLVWMAEADDTAEPNLLSTLLPHFEDRNVFLGYCKSVPTRADGSIIGDYEEIYLNRINEGRWDQNYVVTDHEEAHLGLGRANCIPNASSMILRNFEPDTEFKETVTNMKLCGDWLFYLRAMKGGKVAYNKAPLNYHRRHDQTVTHSVQGSSKYFDEFAITRDYVNSHYRLTDEAKDKVKEFTVADLDRFGVTDEKMRADILNQALPQAPVKKVPSVLFVTADLSPGGGQNFAINQASQWIRRGGRAVLYNARHFPDHEKVLEIIDPRVSLFHAQDGGPNLASLTESMDIDLVQTSLWWAEKVIHNSYHQINNIPWVTSMHGCHETLIKHPETDPTFKASIEEMKQEVSHWVYTAEKNREIFEHIGTPEHLSRIRNGVVVKPITTLSREELGLRKTSVVLCLATRAIETKGWRQAVSATAKLNKQGYVVDLMLIGEGPMADEYNQNTPPHVHLYGQVSNIQDYINVADIGLLPSFFLGESMPLILLEMMAQGKAIITTDVGDIPDMMGEGSQAAGIMVALTKNNTVHQASFNKAIEPLMVKSARTKLGRAAKRRYKTYFTMERMMDEYAKLYDGIIENRAVK
jgi:glycosyltransferase involved in cell wall biosynthesis